MRYSGITRSNCRSNGYGNRDMEDSTEGEEEDDKDKSRGDISANRTIVEDNENALLDNSTQRGRRTPGVSCKALRQAVHSLFRLDDFTHVKIGEGFFSDVFKVTHKSTGQVMVLKKNNDPKNNPNVLKEVQLMNRLHHPNILGFRGVCVHAGQLHALTEYINEGSVEQLINCSTRELPWSLRTTLAADTSKGMHYLHSCGIMHRDLTSKNVLVQREGERYMALVADFGLACKIPDPKSCKDLSVVGSPYWIAPEVIHGKRYTERADIFSFGIIMCELIARIEADPDYLPRTPTFGLDYVAFSKMVGADCPLSVLHLAFNCCQIDPMKRPVFGEIMAQLAEIRSRSQMAIVLADISSYPPATEMLSKTQLDNILDRRGHRRNRSDESLHIKTPSPAAKSTTATTSLNVDDGGKVDVTNPLANVIPVTPLVVGEVMSKDDIYYVPHTDNPFSQEFRNSGKLVGSLCENWQELSELPSTPPSTPSAGGMRRSHSSPTLSRATDCVDSPPGQCNALLRCVMSGGGLCKGFDGLRQELDELSKGFCRGLDFGEDDDACSEGSSSTDSGAVDVKMRTARYLNRPLNHSRHLSVDPLCLSSPSSTCSLAYSRNEMLTRCMEAKMMAASEDRSNQPSSSSTPTTDYTSHLCSSPECLSLDDLSLLSPTSSHNSCPDPYHQMASARYWELNEHKLRSRQKFQELFDFFNANAEKDCMVLTGAETVGNANSTADGGAEGGSTLQTGATGAVGGASSVVEEADVDSTVRTFAAAFAAAAASSVGRSATGGASNNRQNCKASQDIRRQMYLHERQEHTDPLKKFSELRRKWEMKQLTETSKKAAAAQVSAVAAAAAAADELNDPPKKKSKPRVPIVKNDTESPVVQPSDSTTH